MPRYLALSLALAPLLACSSDDASSAPPPPPVAVASISIAGMPDSAMVGDVIRLTAATRDAAGATLAGRTVTWSATDTSLAAVAADGAVTVRAHGPFSVTATSEGKTASAASRGILARAVDRFAYATIAGAAGSARSSRVMNATGGGVRATMNASGDAVVTFERLARAEAGWRETVMVTRAGSIATRCHLNGWGTASNRRDLEVSVSCYATDGTKLPGTFSILVVGANTLQGRHGFVESTDAAATHTPAADRGFNSSGTPMSITRSSAGRYRVVVGNARPAGKTENYFVTTMGPDAGTCLLSGWAFGDSSDVDCTVLGAARADARFSLQLIEAGRAGRRWAYAWNNHVAGPLGAEASVSTSYAASSTAQVAAVTRQTVNGVTNGVYDVRFPGLGGLVGSPFNIQVSPYTSGSATCVPGSTSAANGGADLLVRVECFDRYSFAPTNAYFTILVIE